MFWFWPRSCRAVLWAFFLGRLTRRGCLRSLTLTPYCYGDRVGVENFSFLRINLSDKVNRDDISTRDQTFVIFFSFFSEHNYQANTKN